MTENNQPVATAPVTFIPARRWKRLLAFILDGIISGVASYLVLTFLQLMDWSIAQSEEFQQKIMIGMLTNDISGVLKTMFLTEYTASFFFFSALHVFFLKKWGASPGKMILGMKIVQLESCQHLTVMTIILREFFYKYLVYAFTLGLGLFSIFFQRQARMLYDLMARSIVVEKAPVKEEIILSADTSSLEAHGTLL